MSKYIGQNGYTGLDYCTASGADILGRKIVEYWRRQGKTTVLAAVVPMSGIVEYAKADHPRTIFGLRSNLVNGLPP